MALLARFTDLATMRAIAVRLERFKGDTFQARVPASGVLLPFFTLYLIPHRHHPLLCRPLPFPYVPIDRPSFLTLFLQLCHAAAAVFVDSALTIDERLLASCLPRQVRSLTSAPACLSTYLSLSRNMSTYLYSCVPVFLPVCVSKRTQLLTYRSISVY